MDPFTSANFPMVFFLAVCLLFWMTRAKTATYETTHSRHAKLIPKTIPVDSRTSLTYFVLNTNNAEEAARTLHNIREKLLIIVRHLSTVNPENIPPELRVGIQRLVRRHLNDINLRELDATTSKTIAYNTEKGAVIHVCLRQCRQCSQLAPIDRIFLVALHEIAHSAMKSYEPTQDGITQHGPEFHAYETFLFNVAEKIGLFRYSDVVGQHLCGIDLPDTRLRS